MGRATVEYAIIVLLGLIFIQLVIVPLVKATNQSIITSTEQIERAGR
jgi:hypothetical protein